MFGILLFDTLAKTVYNVILYHYFKI